MATRFIQNAIGTCDGGGTVHFPAGTYLTGTLDVMLELAAGALLLASSRLDGYLAHIPALRSYPGYHVERSLVSAEDVTETGIQGSGNRLVDR